MKTRIVEIPLCDKCDRDGVPYRVSPMMSSDDAFVIYRCDAHIKQLRSETGDATDDSLTPKQKALLDAVMASPGGTSREYASSQSTTPKAVHEMAKVLHSKGCLTFKVVDGVTHYYPVDTVLGTIKVVRVDDIDQKLADAVAKNPGLRPRDYAKMLNVSSGVLSRVSRHLCKRGVIVKKGRTNNVRYFPAKAAVTT